MQSLPRTLENTKASSFTCEELETTNFKGLRSHIDLDARASPSEVHGLLHYPLPFRIARLTLFCGPYHLKLESIEGLEAEQGWLGGVYWRGHRNSIAGVQWPMVLPEKNESYWKESSPIHDPCQNNT